MKENVYMHSLANSADNYYEQVEILKKILKSDALLSLKQQGIYDSYGFNGPDYISLCDYEKRNLTDFNRKTRTAYHSYVVNGISLVFDKDNIDVITPYYLKNMIYTKKGDKLMEELGYSPYRFSDLIDEVQVKDSLSLDNFIYLTFPTIKYLYTKIYFNKKRKYELVKDEINRLKELLSNYNHHVSIYDIESKIELNEDGIKKLIYKI